MCSISIVTTNDQTTRFCLSPIYLSLYTHISYIQIMRTIQNIPIAAKTNSLQYMNMNSSLCLFYSTQFQMKFCFLFAISAMSNSIYDRSLGLILCFIPKIILSLTGRREQSMVMMLLDMSK